MVRPSSLNTLPPLQFLSTLPPPPSNSSPSYSSSSLSSMTKLKTLIHNLIFRHVFRTIQYLNKAKSKTISFLIHVIKESQPMQLIFPTKKSRMNKKRHKIFFGSFRLHYNFCSSTHVLPVPAGVYEGLGSTTHLYYDSNWNLMISTTAEDKCVENSEEAQLSGYLQWLEEKKVHEKSVENESTDENEIDKLANLFIASCHEKFLLEKQESYRRFQEMIARSA